MRKNKIQTGPAKKEKIILRLLILIGLLSIVNFFYWFLKPEHAGNRFLFWLLVGPIIFDTFRIIYIWYHYWDISSPQKPHSSKQFSVDVFTTYFPGEPYEMVIQTLLAIKKMKYPHTTYLCDEADDFYLKTFCLENDIVHVTRNNRKDAKAGNINNALQQAKGEICLILDPDHVPGENFLDEIIPFFENEKIGFVQAVQAYYNAGESSVARGAAEQTYHFYGPMMMTMNAYGTVNAIGANCCFRRKALDSIGGHAPGLSEDMHTAMRLYAKGWKSVYVPWVSTKGLVPATLTGYYKQQLKWSRGTLELLVSVYPKLFKHFTWRQKIHFGLLPLYYLSGVFYLIALLIPIVSLVFATTPWKGNMLHFLLIFLPLFISIIAIRFFVQRWVTEKNERGTHITGGILLACTWWVYLLGFIYTIIRKKVLYLPTPKNDKEATSWKIVVPNLIMGLLSLMAAMYGLSIDLTPFSIMMSGFALANATIMFYTLVYAYQKTRPVKYTEHVLKTSKSFPRKFQSFAFNAWQQVALPVVLFILIVLGTFQFHLEYVKWGGVRPEVREKNIINYLGIFHPVPDNGLSDLNEITNIENRINENFDIVSFYIPWEEQSQGIPASFVDSVFRQNMIPFITWEPWIFSVREKNGNGHVFQLISEGYYDDFITRFARQLEATEKPVFLRFAHEFDNPAYPWYVSEADTAMFRKAWIHTYEIFKKNNAHNVIWVWNPWKPEHIASFYPGAGYVDWVGVNILNYGPFNPGEQWHDFSAIYHPFHRELEKLPPVPVVISEFGTPGSKQKQKEWIENAFTAIADDFSEIKSVVYFDTRFDHFKPAGFDEETSSDWSIKDPGLFKNPFKNKDAPEYVFGNLPRLKPAKSRLRNSNSDRLSGVKGTNLIINRDWQKNYYVFNRSKISSDFDQIRKLGLNTVKFSGNTVYRYNILNAAKEKQLNISYGFWIPAYFDFINDSTSIKKLEKSILKDVEKLKNNKTIISWNLQNDVLTRQKDYYSKPELLFQMRAYIDWLGTLVDKIYHLDTLRPIVIDIEANIDLQFHTNLITEFVSDDAVVGLVVPDSAAWKPAAAFLENNNRSFIFSEIAVEGILRHQIAANLFPSFFVRSWQDTYESNRISFDGITDRKGRLKKEFFALNAFLHDSALNSRGTAVNIIKPAIALYPDNYFDYYATVYNEQQGWKYGMQVEGFQFEWSLVKCDKYGHPLAIKDIGNGPVLSLKIPKNYNYFRLLLTATRNDTIFTRLTKLNTPLQPLTSEITE